MVKSIIGTKVGMTQIFDATGNIIPVTVISAGPCVVTRIRTAEKDGYLALQVGYGDVREKSQNKPDKGQFAKVNVPAKRLLREFRATDVAGYTVGQEIKADIFKPGDLVDVSGITKGKGFAGGMKRHGFGGGPATHGQSDRQRAPGAIGAQGFQRVIKGLRMAGHMGHETVTVQNLEVVSVDAEKNVILIKGAMPGVNKGLLVIEETVKPRKTKKAPEVKIEKKKGGPAPARAAKK